MNTLTYYLLLTLCVGVEIWGQVIGLQDLTYAGAFAALGVIAVDRLLMRADACEEFVGAGEER
ncbi:hypothetical protein [Streptomyces sp. NPDC088752]|uniref:hypothetical protein n=1 Tax=Streptomyces sp. NPDC088752 TaxID=3154963 RepID=UPI00342BC83E